MKSYELDENTILSRWPLRLLAILYFLVCGISSVRYLILDFSSGAGSVPWTVQGLYFTSTLFAGSYLLRRPVGFWALRGVALIGLIVASRVFLGFARF
jgi:hypothetical protein